MRPALLRRLLCVVFLGVVAAVASGCQQEEPEVPQDRQYPEMAPNPDEMVADAVRQLRVLQVIPPGVPLEFLMWPQYREQLLQFVRDWKRDTLSKPEGGQAVAKLKDELEARMRSAREQGNAAVVLLTVDLLRELGSEKAILDGFEQWAQAENNKPVVEVRGMREEPIPNTNPPQKRTIVSIEVRDPVSGAHERVRVEEGEEFYGLRLEEILGNYAGVRLRYLATGETFDVYR